MRFLQTSFLVSSILLATVLSAQSPLTIVNNSFPTGAVGQVYAQALGATGGLQPYVWSATGQIPPGLSVNSVGTISGPTTVGGTYAFTLTVVHARQTSSSHSLSLLLPGPHSRRLTVSPPPL